MKKRLLVLLALFCALLSMAAEAGAWTIAATANTVGGNIVVRGGTPIINDTGTVFYNFTTHANIPVTVNATTGYKVSSVKKNGVYQSTPIASGTTYQMNIANGNSQNFVSYYGTLPVTASSSGNAGGTVSPTGTWSYSYGTLLNPLVVTYAPYTGNNVIAINGLPQNGSGIAYALTDASTGSRVSLPASVNQKVKLTITSLTSNVSFSPVFVQVIANAGAPQYAMPGATVTLNATATTPAGATFAWTQTGGPAVTLSSATAAQPTFTAATVGTYSFKLTASYGGATSTANTGVNVTASAAAAAAAQCVNCHLSSGIGASSNVYGNWSSSRHEATLVMCADCHVGANSGAHPGIAFTQIPNICISCHSGVAATSTQYNNWTKSSHNIANNGFEQISCNSCHNEHSTVATATDDKTDSCAACHKNYGPTANYSLYSSNGVMRTPHGQGVPAYMGGSGGANDNTANNWPVAQSSYMTRGAICTDCHGHDNTINADFAEGAHGAVSNDPMNPFNHYDWSKQTNNGTRQNGNCDRCHTAGGFMKLLGATSDPAYSRLNAGLAPFASYTSHNINKYQANNVLICVSCHKTAEGELRTDATPAGNPTPLSGGYFALFSTSRLYPTSGLTTIGAAELDKTKIQIAFPGYKNSSICVPCHSGRSTAAVFVTVINRAAADFKNYSTVPTSYYQHGKNTAQTFIGTGAYDFTGSLAALPANGHTLVKMGVSDDQGPCVGCHYSSDKPHSLEPTGYATCQACHPSDFGAANVATAQANFAAGVKALDAIIRAQFNPLRINQTQDLSTERANVRFGRFNKAPGQLADATTAKNAYGAWFNWQILETYDAAAYAHNPAYARQILNDTVNYLTGGTTAADAVNAINAQIAAGTITTADATAATAFLADQGCVGCHYNTVDKVSNQVIVTAYNPGHGPTCAQCHDPNTANAHPAVQKMYSTGHEIANLKTTNGNAAKCLGCHFPSATSTVPAGFSSYTTAHFGRGLNVNGVAAGTVVPASKSGGYTNVATCDACHNPHDPKATYFGVYSSFGKSSHVVHHAADNNTTYAVNSDTAYDRGATTGAIAGIYNTNPQSTFPANGANCQRCHNGAAFKSFIDSGFTTITRKLDASYESGSGVTTLTCDSCHTSAPNADGTIGMRSGGSQVTLFINYSATYTYAANVSNGTATFSKKIANNAISVTYPPAGNSNLCITCHAGRDGFPGTVIPYVATYMAANGPAGVGVQDYTKLTLSFGPHDYVMADLFFGKGYNNYLPGAAATTNSHAAIGGTAVVGGNIQGPCVGCHALNKNDHSLLLMPHRDANGKYTGTIKGLDACNSCHSSNGISAVSTDMLSKEAFGYRAALTVAASIAGQNKYASYSTTTAPTTDGKNFVFGSAVNPGGPLVRTNGLTGTAIRYLSQWGSPDGTTVPPLAQVGANANIRLLATNLGNGTTGFGNGDPAPYIHNPAYAKAIIKNTILAFSNTAIPADAASVDAAVLSLISGASLGNVAQTSGGYIATSAAATRTPALLYDGTSNFTPAQVIQAAEWFLGLNGATFPF